MSVLTTEKAKQAWHSCEADVVLPVGYPRTAGPITFAAVGVLFANRKYRQQQREAKEQLAQLLSQVQHVATGAGGQVRCVCISDKGVAH